jgi:hypothetical protein
LVVVEPEQVPALSLDGLALLATLLVVTSWGMLRRSRIRGVVAPK